MSLHRLLIFYKKGPGAIVAARPKSLCCRLGEPACCSWTLLYNQIRDRQSGRYFYGIEKNAIATGQKNMEGIELAATVAAAAALLKSAQFPLHGWLDRSNGNTNACIRIASIAAPQCRTFPHIRLAYVHE